MTETKDVQDDARKAPPELRNAWTEAISAAARQGRKQGVKIAGISLTSLLVLFTPIANATWNYFEKKQAETARHERGQDKAIAGLEKQVDLLKTQLTVVADAFDDLRAEQRETNLRLRWSQGDPPNLPRKRRRLTETLLTPPPVTAPANGKGHEDDEDQQR